MFFVVVQFSIAAFMANIKSLYARYLLIYVIFNMIYVMLDRYSVMLTKHLLGDVVISLLCCVRMMSPVPRALSTVMQCLLKLLQFQVT